MRARECGPRLNAGVRGRATSVPRSAAVVQIARWDAVREGLHFAERTPPCSPPEVTLAPRSIVRAALLAAALAAIPALAPAATPAPRRAPAPAAPAPKGVFTILYGDDHAFGITPPEGWAVDDTAGLGSHIRVVLYPRGQKWDTAPTVMYVNPLHQKAEARRTLRQMIDRDIADFMKRSPKGRVTAGRPLRTGKALVAEVRYFAPEGGEPLEAVAYVAEQDLVMLLVLSSRDGTGFRSGLPAFESLVTSYQFVAGGIQTPR